MQYPLKKDCFWVISVSADSLTNYQFLQVDESELLIMNQSFEGEDRAGEGDGEGEVEDEEDDEFYDSKYFTHHQ